MLKIVFLAFSIKLIHTVTALYTDGSYIANAYKDDVAVIISQHQLRDQEARRLAGSTISSSFGGNLSPESAGGETKVGFEQKEENEVKSKSVTVHQEFKVPYADYHEFLNSPHGHEFMTIYKLDGKNKKVGDRLIKNYKIFRRRSYIITPKGSLKLGAVGRSLWLDDKGHNFDPRKRKQYTVKGVECSSNCEKLSESYNWCYIEEGLSNWDACSPNEDVEGTFNKVSPDTLGIFDSFFSKLFR